MVSADSSPIDESGRGADGDARDTDSPRNSHRSAPSRQRSVQTVAQVRAQEWMNARTLNVTLDSIGTHKVVIFSTHDIEPPPQFQAIWHTLNERHRTSQFSAAEYNKLVVAEQVLIFSDIFVPEHLQGALDIAQSICTLGTEAPPVVLVPHSRAPELRALEEDDSDAEFNILTESLFTGIDEAIVGEPSGVKLAWEIKCRMIHQGSRANELNRRLNSHRQYLRYICDVEDGIEECVWDYLRVRLRTTLPAIDDNIEPEVPQQLDGYVVGQRLGEGAFGVVCRLMDPNNMKESVGQVLKVVRKKPMSDFHGIVCLKRQLAVMRKLSSEIGGHPTIAKFYEVYHSETHILFRMEDGGPLDLYKRLVLLERREMPMSSVKAASIVVQLMAGLSHMHMSSEVSHRDIKPENIITSETDTSITVKISDFDTAQTAKPGVNCRGIIGTFPFMAPEVILTQYYEAFPTDIWSTGIVFLEVLCVLSILKKALSFPRLRRGIGHAEKKQREKEMMERVCQFFTDPDSVNVLLGQFLRPDHQHLVADASRVLRGMLCVTIEDRWTATSVQKSIADMFVQVVNCHASQPDTVDSLSALVTDTSLSGPAVATASPPLEDGDHAVRSAGQQVVNNEPEKDEPCPA